MFSHRKGKDNKEEMNKEEMNKEEMNIDVKIDKDLKSKLKIVILDVGGTLFKTTETTLKFSEYFRSSLKWKGTNNEEIIFIDRSPYIFKHVLSILRDPSYKYPMEYISELDFYGINKANILRSIVSTKDEIISELKNMKTLIENLTTEIKNTRGPKGDCGKPGKHGKSGTMCMNGARGPSGEYK